jgi:hypothetical protein
VPEQEPALALVLVQVQVQEKVRAQAPVHPQAVPPCPSRRRCRKQTRQARTAVRWPRWKA